MLLVILGMLLAVMVVALGTIALENYERAKTQGEILCYIRQRHVTCFKDGKFDHRCQICRWIDDTEGRKGE